MKNHNQKIKTILISSMLTAALGLTACGNSDEKAQENEKSVDVATIKTTTPIKTTMAVNDAEAVAIEALAMADEIDTEKQ